MDLEANDIRHQNLNVEMCKYENGRTQLTDLEANAIRDIQISHQQSYAERKKSAISKSAISNLTLRKRNQTSQNQKSDI